MEAALECLRDEGQVPTADAVRALESVSGLAPELGEVAADLGLAARDMLSDRAAVNELGLRLHLTRDAEPDSPHPPCRP